MFSALAEPQQHSAEDEHNSSRDADDDGPRERGGCCREDVCDGRFCICRKRKQKVSFDWNPTEKFSFLYIMFELLSLFKK